MDQSNHGLLLRPPSLTDYRLGGISALPREVLQEDGQWHKYIPQVEYQTKCGLESMACVSFSALNCIEMLLHRKLKAKRNYSDRFLAKVSGTTHSGNYLTAVAATIRNQGIVLETAWDWDECMTWDQYYAEPPEGLMTQADVFVQKYIVEYEFVHLDLMEALQYAPIQIAIDAYGPIVDGITQPKANSGPANHAITLVGYKEGEYWHVIDHYLLETRKLAWEYPIPHAMRYHIEERNPIPPMDLEENKLYQLVEGLGGFGLAVDNKLIIPDPGTEQCPLAKILSSYLVRTGHGIPLTQEQWDSIPKMNLKREDL